MSKHEKPIIPEAPLSQRVKAQRERILAAAQQCFVRYGFHAASIANIAEAADMSAGLIYRYFPNKSAIVLAIIEQQTEIELEDIRALGESTDLTEALVEAFAHWSHPKPDMRMMNAALFLETSAEATRDAQVAEAIQQADDVGCAEFCAWLERPPEQGGMGMAPELSYRRSLVFLCLMEGLAVRAARDPKMDLELLRTSLAEVMPRLIAE
ncbi:TetR family transcriptional regulator [Luteibacter rhizovicinus]|uniref:TetR family transcriptional regulator n=1 Tax=Luteibacter rhizovicinus TaxID=242606 RepID=A0A4R3YYS9_9GAMM|nr:TetR/AcrR family transcriptional regulator [Luteibacter rhizovicinus]TCV97786.1 TetR family transcriptional regulator [Luteibacter rhizovicinus]